MHKKVLWLVAGSLMVLSLVMSACGPAIPTVPTTPTAPATPAAPTTPTTPIPTAPTQEKPQQEAVKPAGEMPKYGGEIRHAWATDFRGWDDAKVPHFWIRNVAPINQRLLVNDWTRGPSGTGEFKFFSEGVQFSDKAGELAESWDIFPEGRIVFKIRQGIHYGLSQNREASRLVAGRELTAYDVEYSLRRLVTTPGSYHITSTAGMADNVKITALDKWTLEIATTPEFFYVAVYMLAFQAYGDRPREVVEKYRDMTDWRNAVGTGAFLLNDVVPGSSATYVRNPNYWEKDAVGPGKGQQLPYVDKSVILVLPDASTRLAALRTGKLDYLSGLSYEDARDLMKTTPKLVQEKDMTQGGQGVHMRTDKPNLPYKDIRVRQALILGLDYKTIMNEYLGGPDYSYIIGWPVAPEDDLRRFLPTFEELPKATQELYSYNPERARQLLKEAGYPNGFKADIIVSGTGNNVDTVAIIAAMWEKIGVKLTIVPKESSVFSQIQAANSHDDMIWSSSMGNKAFNRWSPFVGDTPQNNSRINQQYINAAKDKYMASWLTGDGKLQERIYKDEIVPRLFWEAWVVGWPASTNHSFWWPWLKNYNGANIKGPFAGFPNQYIWIDRTFKKSMGY